jgi:uncharacterized repeat protein (TIGR01451 family)
MKPAVRLRGVWFAALVLLILGCAGGARVRAQTVFNYTGSAQTYTLPSGAVGAIVIASGGGGGGGGADQPGPGGAGGTGALVLGLWFGSSGSVFTVYVGGGGGGGFVSTSAHSCSTAAGAGGGGGGGYAGGAGANPGCSGYSGGGGGGGAGSEVLIAGTPLLMAGGGSGGQGGSLNSVADGGQGSTAQGAFPASAGSAATFPGNSYDGGGGGGGGGGCPGGAGGPAHPDSSGNADGTVIGAGSSCASSAVSGFTILGAYGGAGGAGDQSYNQSSDPGGGAGGNGYVSITPIFPLGGTVYADTNHNGTLDASETGTGISGLYVKLTTYSSGACQNNVQQVAAVTASTGAFSMSAQPGTYCFILSNDNSYSSITPYVPPGWVGTEAASGMRVFTLGSTPTTTQNFGLYNGSSATVTVFADTGSGSGTANDGVEQSGESGVPAVTVTASVGGSAVATATTISSGSAVLYLPAGTSGSVTIAPTATGGYLATGGSAGTTGGTYSRPSVVFTFASGNAYTGVTFGLIPLSQWVSNNQQQAPADSSVFYAHTFTAGSAGQVTFSTSAQSTPTYAGWAESLYLDSACSGAYASGDSVLSAAITVTAGQRVCVLMKEFVPAGAAPGLQNAVTLSASLAYSGSAAPTTTVLTDKDVTTASRGAGPQIAKAVKNLTASGSYGTTTTASPGNVLEYQLTVSNEGTTSLASVVVDDATPAYTTFVSAACPSSFPTGLTGCTVSVQPGSGGTGALQWSFAGNLQSGAQTIVTYEVTVSQ